MKAMQIVYTAVLFSFGVRYLSGQILDYDFNGVIDITPPSPTIKTTTTTTDICTTATTTIDILDTDIIYSDETSTIIQQTTQAPPKSTSAIPAPKNVMNALVWFAVLVPIGVLVAMCVLCLRSDACNFFDRGQVNPGFLLESEEDSINEPNTFEMNRIPDPMNAQVPVAVPKKEESGKLNILLVFIHFFQNFY